MPSPPSGGEDFPPLPSAKEPLSIPPILPQKDFGADHPSASKSFANISRDNLSDLIVEVPPRAPGTYLCPLTQKEFPAVFFSEEEIATLSAPFKLCLIFKFYAEHPSFEAIRKILHDSCWGVKQRVTISRYDRRHLLIRFQTAESFLAVWTRDRWMMQKQQVKIFRWSAWFRPGLESSILPVWYDLPQLPPCFFNTGCLSSFASVVGRLLKVGPLTQQAKMVVGARICF